MGVPAVWSGRRHAEHVGSHSESRDETALHERNEQQPTETPSISVKSFES